MWHFLQWDETWRHSKKEDSAICFSLKRLYIGGPHHDKENIRRKMEEIMCVRGKINRDISKELLLLLHSNPVLNPDFLSACLMSKWPYLSVVPYFNYWLLSTECSGPTGENSLSTEPAHKWHALLHSGLSSLKFYLTSSSLTAGWSGSEVQWTLPS